LIVGVPPAGQLYHAVYPGAFTGAEDDITLGDLRSYEESAGKTAAWVYFSHNWYRDRRFPTQTAEWIRDAGSVPYIRLMMRSDTVQGHAEPTFTLDRIVGGEFDDDLRAWARAARDFGTPLMAEYGTEVNGEWFPWNGVWNGAGVTDGYGDPSVPDGPERFRDAYRHIIRIARDEGARNVLWVFHANNRDIPDETWNRLENYYPGDEWIDWIGLSVYGAQTPMEGEWPEFRPMMDAVYPRLVALAPGKPIVLAEFGAAARNPLGDQAVWAEAALTDLTSRRWPRVIGMSWWNEWWQNDDDPAHDTTMRVQDDPALADVFQRLVGDNGSVLGRAVFVERPSISVIPVRTGGPDRYETAAMLSASAFATGSADAVVIATGQNFPDALCAGGLAGAVKGPVLLTQTNALPFVTLTEARRVTKGAVGPKAYIVGSASVVATAVANKLSAAGFSVTRYAGADRYATAAAVATAIKSIEGAAFLNTALVARGDTFPDALAVSPFACSQGMPILLTKPNELPPVTRSAVTGLGVTDVVVAGSTSAVSAAVAGALGTLPGVGPPVRAGGAGRYDTAIAVVDLALSRGWASAGYVGAATGKNYPDALSGGAIAGAKGGVVLLTDPAVLSPQASAFVAAHRGRIRECVVFGSDLAVSTSVKSALAALLK
jgi:putative cell wall-binding protein